MANSKTTVKVIKDTSKKERKESKPVAKSGGFARTFFRPLTATGRYIKLSWAELRQVRWPNRRTTWKLTLSVIVYCVIFATLIMLLDMLFQFIFNKALG
ncbi:MAG: preprotein translocase subunit SecE [Candidatus Nomurabacteria bacterium]|jgi:preprotein translocase SecE subunit|nr:preprotein translocase subunit SecE [Candidatus Nomurabacteria bacterium]